MEAKTTRNSVFHTNYHIVFCPKYRRKVFKDDIAKYLEQFFKKQVEKKGWTLIAIEVRPNHIHLFIEGIPPITRLSDVVKYLKGTSGLSLLGFPKITPAIPQREDMVTKLLCWNRWRSEQRND